MLDVRRYSRSKLGCRLVAICVTWAFLIPKRLLRKALRQNLRTSSIFFHWQRIGEGEGAAAGGGTDSAKRKGRGSEGLSGRGGGFWAAAGAERSRAPVGAGRRPAHRGDGADGAGRRPCAAALRAAARLRRWRD